MKKKAIRQKVMEVIVGEMSLAEIVLAAWKLYPDDFCLDGYQDFPDSHRVRCALYGRNGLIRKRSVKKKRDGTFVLTVPRPLLKQEEEDASKGFVAFVNQAVRFSKQSFAKAIEDRPSLVREARSFVQDDSPEVRQAANIVLRIASDFGKHLGLREL